MLSSSLVSQQLLQARKSGIGMHFIPVYTAGAGYSVPVEQHCQVQYGMDCNLGVLVTLHCCKKSTGSWFRQKYLLCEIYSTVTQL